LYVDDIINTVVITAIQAQGCKKKVSSLKNNDKQDLSSHLSFGGAGRRKNILVMKIIYKFRSSSIKYQLIKCRLRKLFVAV
jgi:hypothetical protein